MSVYLAIQVDGGHAWGPSSFQVDLQVSWVDAAGFGRGSGGDLPIPIGTSPSDANAMIRAAGIAIAAAAGFVIGPDDPVLVFGGVAPISVRTPIEPPEIAGP